MIDTGRNIRVRGAVGRLIASRAEGEFPIRDRAVCYCGAAGTGKTFGICVYLVELCERYKGLRVMIARATRASMAESVMVTLESKVFDDDHPAITPRKLRSHRHSYDFPNGSSIVCVGLDKVTRTYSAEYDIIYVCEATEIDEETFEGLFRSLRSNVLPWQQIIIDCNPDVPTHWIKRRADAGTLRMMTAKHADNPGITEEYLETLRSLTGVRRKRLYEGLWCAAEGMVWEGWDETANVVDAAPTGGKYIAAVDWGYTHPGTLQVWHIDKDGRVCLVAEWYATKRGIDWWTARAVEANTEFKIERFFCDPAEPGFIDAFKAAKLNAVGAKNDIREGLDAVRARIVPAGDGRRRLTVYRHALREKDSSLAERKQPTCLKEEIVGYVYPNSMRARAGELPDPRCPDHACDTARYAVMGADSYSSLTSVEVIIGKIRVSDEFDERWWRDA